MKIIPFSSDHTNMLISWVDSEQTHRLWTGQFFRFPLASSQINAYLEQSKQVDSQHEMFMVLDSTDTPVAYVELSHIWPHLSARVSRLLVAPEHRGQGIGTIATGLLLDHGFNKHAFHRIDLGVMADNTRAKKVYENLGFKLVGRWAGFLKNQPDAPALEWMSIEREVYLSQKP